MVNMEPPVIPHFPIKQPGDPLSAPDYVESRKLATKVFSAYVKSAPDASADQVLAADTYQRNVLDTLSPKPQGDADAVGEIVKGLLADLQRQLQEAWTRDLSNMKNDITRDLSNMKNDITRDLSNMKNEITKEVNDRIDTTLAKLTDDNAEREKRLTDKVDGVARQVEEMDSHLTDVRIIAAQTHNLTQLSGSDTLQYVIVPNSEGQMPPDDWPQLIHADAIHGLNDRYTRDYYKFYYPDTRISPTPASTRKERMQRAIMAAVAATD